MLVANTTNSLVELRCPVCTRYFGAVQGRGYLICTKCGGAVSYMVSTGATVADVVYLSRAERMAGREVFAPTS